MLFLYTTCESTEEAEKLANIIIDNKIAACVDFWPISSCYNWEGKRELRSQVMLLVTTFEKKLDAVIQIISDNHTYSIPMIAGVDVRRINHPYKEWMMNEIE